MYTLYNSSVELDTRLATVPQLVFHYNILLTSLAIDHFFSEDSNSIFQQLPGYQPRPQLGYQLLLLRLTELNPFNSLTAPKYMTSGRTEEKTPSQRKHPSVIT
jgi:hypothetical protein